MSKNRKSLNFNCQNGIDYQSVVKLQGLIGVQNLVKLQAVYMNGTTEASINYKADSKKRQHDRNVLELYVIGRIYFILVRCDQKVI